MKHMTKGRREIISLIRHVPMTALEIATIIGKHRETVCRNLYELEANGFAIRYGVVRPNRQTAALWHWTGKDFGYISCGHDFDAMTVQALQLPNQMRRYECGITIALRLDGKDNRHAVAA